MPSGGAFVRRAGIRERKCAVDRDADGAASSKRPRSSSCGPFERTWVIETVTPSFAASSASEKPKHREQSAATLERDQETTGGGTAERIENEIDVVRDVLGTTLGVVDDFVGVELALALVTINANVAKTVIGSRKRPTQTTARRLRKRVRPDRHI